MRHVPTIRERDKAALLSLVWRHGSISRAALRELTALRPATISRLTRELIDEGKLVEAGLSDNAIGRKQILLRVKEDFSYIAALDFSAEKVTAAVLDINLRPCGTRLEQETDLTGGVEGLVSQLLGLTRQTIEECGVGKKRLLGIGIGDPGLVNQEDGISVASSTIEFWRDVPLRAIFEREFLTRVVIGNNTRAKAQAECLLGAGDGAEDMIWVEYGQGIGTGIIVGGRMMSGRSWMAGEFGHTHVVDNGPPCNCGSFGCLEAIAGVKAVEAKLRKALQEGCRSLALEAAGGDLALLSGWHVFEAARTGDKMSLAIVEEVATYLGLGISNLVNLFNPSLIVLDPRLRTAGDEVLDQIICVVKRQALAPSTEGLEFRFGQLGDDAGILGAGILVFDKIFEIPALKPLRYMLSPDGSAARKLHQAAGELPVTRKG